MKERLLAFGLPAVVVGAVFGGGVVGAQTGWIPPAVWQFLWPSLVALLFLLLSLGAVFIRAWRWLWPFGAGFVVQTVTTILVIPRWLKPIETLEYTLLTVGFVLFVMLVIWLVVLLRARWLEQRMVNGLSSATGVDQQEVAKIRKSMAEALALLKRAGGGRNAIYKLPWFLVIGRSQAGKTVAIKNSGLGLPVRKDWVKGVGGTHTCDFFFTNDLIFLDTPGDWVTKSADDSQQKEWVELVRLLRRYRGRRPLDGIVVLVPSDDLLTRSDQELSEQASNARVVIDLLQSELQFRFPVYLLVSKTDLVEGFSDFFRGVPARRRNEILGWSHEDPNAGDPPRLIREGFRRVVGRLQAYRLEMLARIASKTQARRLFFFTDEFANLERPLGQFASVLFEESVQGDRPVFRGFYFTSGTQGEGTPLGQAMGNLARTLGVRLAGTPQQAAGEEEPKRGYFLLDLFRRLMIGDQGLVGRTAVHWWRRRRGTMVGTFLVPALLAVFFVLSLLSFAINSARYHRIGQEVPLLADELRKGGEFSGDRILEALGQTEQIAAFHRKLTGMTLFAGFFMRRPGDLDPLVFQAFAEPFRDVILEPTLRETERFATDEEQSCTDRVDALYSVIWLREGRVAEWSSDLLALGKIWNLRDDDDQRDASLAREKLLEQFAYYKDHAPRGTPLLPGFDLAKVATGLEKRCSRSGSLSSLEKYSKFLGTCGSAGLGQVVPCWKYDLDEVLRFAGEDAKRIRRHLKSLKQDLRDLRGEEVQAEAALEAVERLNVQEASSDSCDAIFDRDVVPAIRKYVEKQQPLIDECREEWVRSNRRRLSALKKVEDQEKGLQEDAKRLNESLLDFEKRCRDNLPSSVDFSVRPVSLLAREYRKLDCQEQAVLTASGTRRPPRGGAGPVGMASSAVQTPGSGAGAEPVSDPKPAGRTAVATRMLDYFEASVPLSRDWTYQGWSARKAAWQQESAEASSIGGDQGAELVAVIRKDVTAYGEDYYRAWKRYLAGLRPKEIRTSAPAWLQGLATTGEYRRLLAPNGPAVPPEAPDDQLVEAFNAGTGGLRPLAAFVAADLGAYQDLLGKVGADLERCAKDGTYWAQYRSQIANRAPENNLVRTRELVTRVAGTGLADGALQPFLMAPLDRAADYLASTDLVGRQWSDLTTLYKTVSVSAPFATDGAADALVERSQLIALLGGKSGVVPVLQEIGRSATLSPDAVDWLANASRLSSIFFEKGADEPRKLRLKVTLKEYPVTPENAAKDYELRGIEIHLGSENKLKWDLTQPFVPEAGSSCPLFGDDAPGRALISLMVAERKGAMGRAFTGNWKDPELKPVEAAGPWAVLRLLLMGAPDKLPESGNAVDLSYPVRLVEKGKEPPTLTLRLKAEAEGLPAMLRLLRSGLRPPPDVPGGGGT